MVGEALTMTLVAEYGGFQRLEGVYPVSRNQERRPVLSSQAPQVEAQILRHVADLQDPGEAASALIRQQKPHISKHLRPVHQGRTQGDPHRLRSHHGVRQSINDSVQA